MSKVKFGELSSWEDGETGSGTNDFMNLKEGDNIVRIFTNPYQFFVAWVRDSSGANRKIRSAIDNCPLVKAGHQIRPRWYVGVLDRSSGLPKILEIPSTVFGAIKNYVNDSDYGDVKQYDLKIKRGPKGTPPAQLYTVMPKPKKPLTDEEKALIASFKERVDIAKFTKPPTAAEVAEKLGVVLGEDDTPKVAVGRQTVAAQSVAKPDIADDEFEFGDDDEL